MRLPDGQDFWSKGEFTEIAPPERLAFEGAVVVEGERKFASYTTVTFETEGAGTRMSVRQAYDIFDPAFQNAVEGSAGGLAHHAGQAGARGGADQAAANRRSVVHASFTLERIYDAAPAQVFRALTDIEAKARWFSGGEGYEILEREMDVRPGGRERLKGRWASGVITNFEAVYFDVIPNERLVYAYEMHLRRAQALGVARNRRA